MLGQALRSLRRLILACVSITLTLAVNADWKAVKLQSGLFGCQDMASGLVFDKLPYSKTQSDATKFCKGMPALFSWIGSLTEAQSIAVIPGLVRAPTGQPINPTPQLNPPWSQCDVGMPATAGTASNGGGTLIVAGAGDVSNGGVLVTHVAYQAVTGPIDVNTVIQSIAGSFDYRKAGILFTAGNPCSAPGQWVSGSASVETNSGQQGVAFNLSNVVNGRSEKYYTAAGGQPPPQGLRLTYDGTIASFYFGSPGNWTLVDSETRTFTGTYYVSIFASSGGPAVTELATATFTEPTVQALAGSAGTLTLTASSQSVLENAGSFTICATRGGGTSGAASARVHNAGTGTATGSDWTTSDLDQTLNWSNGDAAQKCTTAIHVTNRAGTQGTRTINVVLDTFTGASAGALIAQTISILDVVTVTGAIKWHPGPYMNCCFNGTDLSSQPSRFAQYDYFQTFSNVKGAYMYIRWVDLESSGGGDYSAGIALIRSEVAHLKNEPHPLRLAFVIPDEPNSGICHDYTCQDGWYPSYLRSTCLAHQQFNNANDVNTVFKWWINSCATAFNNLIAALGAALDSEPYLEIVQINYEEQLQDGPTCCGDFNYAAYNSNIQSAMAASRAAFPHTNIKWNANWGIKGVDADLVTLIGYAKANGIGWGSQDACSIDPVSFQNVYGTYPIYQDAQNIFAGYGGYSTGHHAGTYTDQRGKMFSADGAETSELGYNVVCNGQGFAGYAPAGSSARNAGYMDLYSELNAEWASHWHVYYNTFTGTAVQQWSVGTTGSLWDLVQNHGPIHTACPTDYDTLFGNGTAGSGCNTN